MDNQWNKFVIIAVIIFATNAQIINLDQGWLRGTTGKDRCGNAFYSFLSIPYAQPPVGKLRFADSLPPTPWQGILNATTDLVSCPQTSDDQVVGQEDCLYLNVHTPELPNCRLKPVIVYVHGGSLVEGSGTSQFYGAELLMPGNVVLVTINYRLGLLGFLNSQDPNLKIPGNAALKDQTMALKWVRKNIAKFGGDPDNVTLMGQSSGGSSVHMHMFTPLSEGLFHRVIATSGSIGDLFGRGVKDSIVPVAQRLGINATDPSEMLKQLRSLPFGDIVTANQNITVPIHELVEITPIVEYKHPNAFITVDPAIPLQTGRYNQVPLMIGHTDNEGLFPQVLTRLTTGQPFVVDDFAIFIPYNLRVIPTQREDLKKELKEFYYGSEEPGANNVDKTNTFVTDSIFIAPVWEVLRRQVVSQTLAPIYYYVFSADTEMNYFKRLSNVTAQIPGACHTDDLGYAFRNIYTPVIKPCSPEDISITNYVNLITSFARNGCPDPKFHWNPFTLERQDYLDIGGVNLVPKVKPDQRAFKFWQALYDRYVGNNVRFVEY